MSKWSDGSPSGSASQDEVAPSPRIRVGLSTRAEAVRITSSLPFQVRSGRQWLVAQDVLIDRVVDGYREGSSYSIQVASFLSRSEAESFLARLQGEAALSGRVEREFGTGRYAVRTGSWSTMGGARASVEGLTRLGYTAARVVAQPSSSRRPTSLLLHRPGVPPARTSELSLVILPAARGAWLEVDGSPYRGYIEIAVNASNRLTVVNILNVEDYLRGVVPAELSPAIFPEVEAIKAQAVAARTYAVRHLGQFAPEGFDICSTAACQVYQGVRAEQRMSDEAVADTAGRVLTYGGELIDALYTSTCGGRTEDVQNVFDGEAQPYLISRACYVEGRKYTVSSNVDRGLSWEAAGAVVTGLVHESEIEGLSLDAPLDASQFSTWGMRAIERLGQSACRPLASAGDPVTLVAFTRALTETLCWEGRLPFLTSDLDTERLIPSSETEDLNDVERRALAYWIEEQWVHPASEGLAPHRAVSRMEAMESLFRLVDGRGEPALTEGVLIAAGGDRLWVKGDETEEPLPLAVERYLFRRVESTTFYAPTLALMPGDHLLYHRGDEGVDLIILLSHRTSFDRSSRFFRWTIRRLAGELTQAINEREPLGPVVELRPTRYGKSGRVVDLTVVGVRGSKDLHGLAIRQWLGIRENLFYIDRQLDDEGNIRAWVFTGGGWGHGVGLCQVGAYGMAAAGMSFADILSHYYPGTDIVFWSGLPARE